jgi:hypothetical protein
VNRRISRGVRAFVLAATVTGSAAACSLPDVSMSPGVGGTAAAPTTSAARSSAVPTPATRPAAVTATAPRPSGALDTGSVTHSLPAGNRTVVIDYWTTQDATSWTALDPKTIQLAAHVEGGGTAEKVEVTRFAATADDGKTRTAVTEDRGEFVITPPFSYTTAVLLAPSAARTTTLTVYVQFDLLVETAPKSGTFFRQTVLDSLVLPLTPEVAP